MKAYLSVTVLTLGLVLSGCNRYYADQATRRGIQAHDTGKEAKRLGDMEKANYNYRLAQQEFELAAQQDPTGTDRHYNLATASQALKEYEQAIRQYDRSLECYPGNGKAHSGKIDCLVEMDAPQQRIDRAVAVAVDIVDPGRIYLTQAQAYYRVGRAAEMPAILAKAVESSPGDSYVQATAGRFYRALGDKESARKRLRRAYELNPDEPWVAYDLGTLGEKRLPPVAGE